MECTGISASYCPVHGDCTCPRHKIRDWDDIDLHPELVESGGEDPDCPLHSPASTHGEEVVFETVWGAVPAALED
jgi:hypothetical protein